MSGSKRKAVMALIGSVVLTGLVMPASAQAAVPSVKIEVCNTSGQAQVYRLAGRNQHGTWYRQPNYKGLFRDQCDVFADWWATGQDLQVFYYRNVDSNGTPMVSMATSYISKNLRDGATGRVTVDRRGA